MCMEYNVNSYIHIAFLVFMLRQKLQSALYFSGYICGFFNYWPRDSPPPPPSLAPLPPFLSTLMMQFCLQAVQVYPLYSHTKSESQHKVRFTEQAAAEIPKSPNTVLEISFRLGTFYTIGIFTTGQN
jgi:hypothetical protein